MVYDLTPDEISAYIEGKSKRLKETQKADNIRIGTLCATVLNQNRRKRNDKIWKWSDFFPERTLRNAVDVKAVEREAMRIKRMFGG